MQALVPRFLQILTLRMRFSNTEGPSVKGPVTVVSDYDIVRDPCGHCRLQSAQQSVADQDWIQDLVTIKFLPDGRPSFHCTLSLHHVASALISIHDGNVGGIRLDDCDFHRPQ